MSVTKEKYRNHIISKLRELDLSDEQIQPIVPVLIDRTDFLNGVVSFDSPIFSYKEKVIQSAELMGVKKDQFVRAALKQPSLFYQSPKTLNSNVEGSTELMGITKDQFVRAALKRPSLFTQSPATLNSNVEGSTELMGITKDQFVPAALKHAPLFTQSPATLNSNVEGSAELMGITKDQFVRAALKRPQLFYQLPETLNSNVEGSTELMGITKNELVRAALKNPALFYQSPETISRHAALMNKMAEKNLVPESVEDYYLNNPFLLSLADNNFHLRMVFALHQSLENHDNFSLLKTNRKTIERNFAEALGHDPDVKTVTEPRPLNVDINSKELQNLRILIANIKNGLLKSYQYKPDENSSLDL